MCLFLALNTSAVALLPTGVIAARAALGSGDPAGILVPTLLATTCSTAVAITAAFLLAKLPVCRRTRPPVAPDAGGTDGPEDPADPLPADESPQTPPWNRPRLIGGLVVLALTAAGLVYSVGVLSRDAGLSQAVRSTLTAAPLPLIILLALGYGWARGVSVYSALVEGAREGVQVAIRIIPFLVAVLVAIGMFRASGALEWVVGGVGALTAQIGLPGEALPMALLRPLSGSGAYAVMSEIMKTPRPDSFVGYLVSTMQGSTETTFYVLAVYGGQVGLARTRHALPACLIADLAGIAAATASCHVFFGHLL